jgi:hypothetical protein
MVVDDQITVRFDQIRQHVQRLRAQRRLRVAEKPERGHEVKTTDLESCLRQIGLNELHIGASASRLLQHAR